MKIDKLLNSPWFVRIVALFLALMLYTVVNMESTTNNSQVPSLLPQGTQEYESFNVPLIAYYNRDKYAVSNLPNQVTVYLEGASSAITTTKMQDNFQVFVDLQELKPGEHEVKIQHLGFSKKLNVRIEPSTVQVNIQEKTSRTFPVEIEFLNENKMVEGYTTEQPIILQNTVKITGAKEKVKEVALVKGFVDLKGKSKTFEIKVPLKIYDQYGDLLNLQMNPQIVEVKVPIVVSKKVVPIKIDEKTISNFKSIKVIPNEVTLYGNKEILDQIDSIDSIPFDFSTVEENVTKTVKIPLPEGVKEIKPEKVKVKITVD